MTVISVFALSTGRHKEEIKEERNKLTEFLKKWGIKESRESSGCIFQTAGESS